MKSRNRDYERPCPRCGGETTVSGNWRDCRACVWHLLKGERGKV